MRNPSAAVRTAILLALGALIGAQAAGTSVADAAPFLPAQVAVDSTLATDDFSRSLAQGLGDAPLGGTWSLGGPQSSFTVADGLANFRLPAPGAGTNAHLNSLSAANVDQYVDVKLQSAPTGGGTYVSLVSRRVNSDHYRVTLRFSPSGSVQASLVRKADGAESTLATVDAVSAVSSAPGNSITVRFLTSGTSPTQLRAKVWRAGMAEPTNWTLSAADDHARLRQSGSVGLMTYLSSTATNAPVALSFDNFVAKDPNSSPAAGSAATPAPLPTTIPLASDTFARTTIGGFGTAESGGPWTMGGNPSNFSVSAGTGRLRLSAAGIGTNAYLNSVVATSSDTTAEVTIDKAPTGGGTYVSLIGRRQSSGLHYRTMLRFLPNGTVQVAVIRASAGLDAVLNWVNAVPGLLATPAQPVRVRFQIEGTNPTLLRAKVWRAIDVEPKSWLLTAGDQTTTLQQPGSVGIMSYLSTSATSSPTTVGIESFDVLPLGGAPITSTSTPTVAPTTTTTVAAPAPTTTVPAPAATTTTVAAPAPTTTTPVAPTTVVAPTGAGRPAEAAGTVVGSRSYPVPAGAIVVSPSGSDAAAGTATSPLRTVGRAIAVATSGTTIVLREGSYHENVTVPSSKRLTIQAWPLEAVWFDGSVPVTGWVADGNAWRKDGWTIEFDSSPTFTRGAPDNTAEYWNFINPSYPMAAHPDQIWVNGVALSEVSSRSLVTAGKFFHDEPGNRLYIGTNPTGAEVRAAALQRSLRVLSDGSVLRGFGVRRYAPSVPDIATLVVEARGVLVEHVAVVEASTTAITAVRNDVTFRNLYLAHNGMLGLNVYNVDNFVLDSVLVEHNNRERFNPAPAAGGAKLARVRDVTVRNSTFRNNEGTGLWFDISNYDMKIIGNDMRDNATHGAFLEISDLAVFADNIVEGNAGDGLKVNNTSNVRVWNNTFVGNGRSLNIVQDDRVYATNTWAKHPNDPPSMTWLLGPVEVRNNVVANPRSGNCLLCVEDYSRTRSAEAMGISANSNVYNRASTSSPTWAVVWSRGSANPAVFNDLIAFRTATGQESNGVLTTGTAIVDREGKPTTSMPNSSIAQPLPASIATLVSQPTGARRLGAWIP
jgi:hypothetical protein